MKNGDESAKESENSTLLKQIFKERLYNSPAHNADSAGTVYWKHRKNAPDVGFFGDETPFF